METKHSLEDPQFLRLKLADACTRQSEKLRSMFSAGEQHDNQDYRVATLLLGFATLLFAIEHLVPKARPEVTRQTAAIKCLTSMVRKDMTKTGCSIDIFSEITHQSRTLSDISFGRLIDLFELAGFNNQERIAAELPGFVAWAKDEVDYFNSQIQPAWKVEPKSPNFEINLDHSVNRKPPAKPQKKLGQRLAATMS